MILAAIATGWVFIFVVACSLMRARSKPTPDFTRATNERPAPSALSRDAINAPEPRVSGRYRSGSGAQSHYPHGGRIR